MILNKYIIKSIIDRQRVFTWLIYNFCSIILAYNHVLLPLYSNIYRISFFFLCSVAIFRSFFSIFNFENIRSLYLLPISFPTIYGNILFSLYLDIILGKILPFIILIKNCSLAFLINLFFISLVSLLSIFIIIFQDKYNLFYFFIPTICLLLNNTFTYLLSIIVCFMIINNHKTPVYISRTRKYKLCHQNYFLTKIIHNRYFWINTISLIIFIMILTYKLSELNHLLFLSLIFSILTINSPILTILSIDKDTHRQILLSPKPTKILKQYFIVLLSYFILGNSIIYLYLNVTSHINLNIRQLAVIGSLSILEALYSIWIEYKFPIVYTKKEQIWKSPRKYILLILAYIFVFMFI